MVPRGFRFLVFESLCRVSSRGVVSILRLGRTNGQMLDRNVKNKDMSVAPTEWARPELTCGVRVFSGGDKCSVSVPVFVLFVYIKECDLIGGQIN